MRKQRGAVIGLALFTAFSVTVTWMVFATLQRNVSGPTNTYSAVFTDVSGLKEGDDVRVAGVRVGRVDTIELAGGQAKVTFRVQRDQTLFTNTVASVTYQNIIGQRYVGLTEGAGTGQELRDGAELPRDRTTPSFDISYMLNGFEPLFTELDPQQVDNLTNAVVQAFQGDQGSLLALTTQASTLASTLAGPDQVLGELITNLDRLMVTLAGQSEHLKTMLHQSQSALAALASRRGELIASMGSITATVQRLSRIVAAVTPDLQQFIEREPGFLQHGLTDGRARFAFMAANVPLLLKGLARVTQEGSYINAYACDVDLGLWRGLFNWFRAFVVAATPGNGNEVWHSPICR
ncbi:MCE family protein [Mycobacterium sp. CBMA293]|uniref:MlaD family protein n=1 Tax=unclassified Mycolicibacterium TaxID=2636767 RepID=UPI0012DD1029|nr:MULTISPECIES: MlaD family protein [unclassified Mycolicibacterium]MUL47422.1 MCE family protein [Mycolicibacterium sp. CBMA 360]MUL59407.1 MCE family protein [Mycolicibacterium sp. CBMA 335]MUL71132.1 MCE family protein [Mycolicibacterium sp. CBMA 311]MUL94775.1 MCE family protein [Mycolicibacterium sp. CBMA 230]MUM03616.1 mammalian cell entry protein [Mycolicibacterium sp. CBMA 213]